MSEGICRELDGIQLGDKRLNRRSKLIAETLAANPAASINAACDGWSDTLATYRFFDNEAVDPEQILLPHREATRRRMQAHSVVLIVQDTTELDYSKHPAKDAKCLNAADRFGLYLHTHLAVTPNRLCLGVAGTDYFDRTPESLGQANSRVGLPIEQKESFRWLNGYRLACELAAKCPQTQIVSVSDRESDIYEIFAEAQQTEGRRADYVVRAKDDRCTPQRDSDGGPYSFLKVMAEVSRSPLRAIQTIELSQTPKRAARQAVLEIRATQVTIKPPHGRSYLPSVTHNMVLLEEVNGPGDGTDVSWMLTTTLPIETLDQIQKVVDYYVARWTVEVYFRTLKTGCQVEEIQLETTPRLKRCLAFYQIIAWRILYLTHLSRNHPKMPCTEVFDDFEWKSVWVMAAQKPIPDKPPNLAKMMTLLAQLGGYNNRASDPPPGPQAIWCGLRRMADFAAAWLAFGPKE